MTGVVNFSMIEVVNYWVDEHNLRDAAGNLLEVKEDTATVEAYTYDAGQPDHERRASPTTTDGNLTADGTRSFLYDGKGRLVEVKEGETTLAQMTYDYLDRRTSLTTAGGTTYFHYVGADVVAETDEDGDVLARYTYGPAGLLSMTRGGETYFYQRNAHGDVVSLTDDSGAVVNTYTYDPWGKLLSATEQVANPYRYAGYRYDSATGLYYLWHRYYDPGVRRFLTEDPVGGTPGRTQSTNAYTYVENKPQLYRDPSGLSLFFEPMSRAFWFDLVTDIGSLAADSSVATECLLSGNFGGLGHQVGFVALDVGCIAAGQYANSIPAKTSYVALEESGGLLVAYKRWNFRRNLGKLSGGVVGGADAHHMLPENFKSYFDEVGLNINDPKFGAWWELHDHRRKAWAYKQEVGAVQDG